MMGEKVEDMDEIRRHCYHETGHAVCMILGGVGVKQVVISEKASHTDRDVGCTIYPLLRAILAGGEAQQQVGGFAIKPADVSCDLEDAEQQLDRLESASNGTFDRAKVHADALSDAQFVVGKYAGVIEMTAKRLLSKPKVADERVMSREELKDLITPAIEAIQNDKGLH